MPKYRVMVVDDEKFIRKSIINRVNWEKLDLEVVAEADNGMEAYHKAVELKPDILLVDIRMPLMNGIEVIRQVKKTDPEVHFIILSGYDDFEYTKEAIKLGVSNYIKKPIDEKELEETLQGIIGSIEQRREAELQKINLSALAQETEKERRFRYLNKLVHGSVLGAEHVPWLSGRVHGIVLIYFPGAGMLPYEAQEALKDQVAANVKNMLQAFPYQDIQAEAFLSEQKPFLVCLLASSRTLNQAWLMRIAFALLQDRKEYTAGGSVQEKLYIAVSGTTAEIGDISDFYGKALSCLKYKMFMKNVKLYTQESIRDWVSKNNGGGFHEFLFQAVEFMRKSAEGRNVNEMVKILENVFCAGNVDKLTVQMLETVLRQIGSIMNKLGAQISLSSSAYFSEEIYSPCYLLKFNDVLELKNELCSEISRLLIENSRFVETNTVERIKKYVQLHYAEDISVNQIAGEFYINPNYLSQLFKDATGINLGRYIEDIRMEKATRLLSNLQVRIRDIALHVGYSDPNYFCKVFKKHTGMTPVEYQAGLNLRHDG